VPVPVHVPFQVPVSVPAAVPASPWLAAAIWLPLLTWSVVLVARRGGRGLPLWAGPLGWITLAAGQAAASGAAMTAGWALIVLGVWAVVERPVVGRRARAAVPAGPAAARVLGAAAPIRRVVVGVGDAAPALTPALWAVGQVVGGGRGGVVELVSAYDPHDVVLAGPAGGFPAVGGEWAARARLQSLLDDVRRSVPDAPVVLRPLPGRPGAVLLTAGIGADLLVLGQPAHRWTGRLGALLAGSTSRVVLRGATCPVALVAGSEVAAQALGTGALGAGALVADAAGGRPAAGPDVELIAPRDRRARVEG